MGKVRRGPERRHIVTEGSTAQERLFIFTCTKSLPSIILTTFNWTPALKM